MSSVINRPKFKYIINKGQTVVSVKPLPKTEADKYYEPFFKRTEQLAKQAQG